MSHGNQTPADLCHLLGNLDATEAKSNGVGYPVSEQALNFEPEKLEICADTRNPAPDDT